MAPVVVKTQKSLLYVEYFRLLDELEVRGCFRTAGLGVKHGWRCSCMHALQGKNLSSSYNLAASLSASPVHGILIGMLDGDVGTG